MLRVHLVYVHALSSGCKWEMWPRHGSQHAATYAQSFVKSSAEAGLLSAQWSASPAEAAWRSIRGCGEDSTEAGATEDRAARAWAKPDVLRCKYQHAKNTKTRW